MTEKWHNISPDDALEALDSKRSGLTDEQAVFKLGVFRNRWLTLAIGGSILLQLAVVYVPFFQVAFSTVPLDIGQWGVIVLAGGSLFVIEELRKFFFPGLFNLGKWKPLKASD